MLRGIAPLARTLLPRTRPALLLSRTSAFAGLATTNLRGMIAASAARHAFSSSHGTQVKPAMSAASTSAGSASPSVAAAGVDASSPYSQLEARFLQYVPRSADGLDALAQLRAMASSPPGGLVLLLGGDQCTGKSTLSNNLARTLQGNTFSAGQLFRQKAKDMGITSAELSRRALKDPAIDVGIEFSLCQLILRGNADGHPLVIEGRQPVVMENFLRARFGRGAAVRLRLTCSVREQAMRFIEREAGPEVLAFAQKALPASLPSLRAALPFLPAEHKSNPGLARLSVMFADNDQRDEDDRARYVALYGDHKILDYRNPALYDAVIDTTHNQSKDTFRQSMEVVHRLCPKVHTQSKL